MRNGLLFTLIILIAVVSARAAGAQRETATIQNSGSTNTAGFTITLASDGNGTLVTQGAQNSRAIVIAPDLVTRFFTDVRATYAENPPAQHCMKSMSFGTRTTVAWNGWTSPDLQCPGPSENVGALANDVRAIEAAAGAGPGATHRIGLPPGLRKNPPATPEAQPT